MFYGTFSFRVRLVPSGMFAQTITGRKHDMSTNRLKRKGCSSMDTTKQDKESSHGMAVPDHRRLGV